MNQEREGKPNAIFSTLARMALAPRAFLKGKWSKETLSLADQQDLERYKSWLVKPLSTEAEQLEGIFLIASFMPLTYCIKIESLIGHAMSQKGFKVVVVTNMACQPLVSAYHEKLNGFKVFVLDDYLSITSFLRLKGVFKTISFGQAGVLNRIKEICYRGAHIGLHSLASLSAGNDVDLTTVNKENIAKLKRIISRSVFMVDASLRLIERIRPSLLLSVEKGFVGTSEIFYAAINNNIKYVQWTGCHEPNSIMFKRYTLGNFREHPFSLSNENWEAIKQLPWNDDYARGVMHQFQRGYTEGQWFKYKNLTLNQHEATKLELLQELSLDAKKKTAVIYSHILNDANLFYGKDLFIGGYEEWLVETIRAAAYNKSVNWVLKLHPANMYRNPSLSTSRRYGELQALENEFGCVPDFLTVIYPDSAISPMSFFGISDYGVTVRGTVGLELPCFGIPTITAGTGRYSGKGFTVDSTCREEYISNIKNIHEIPPLSLEQIKLGQRYAYYIFNVRPARYGDAFTDSYSAGDGHSRRRDINFGEKTIVSVLNHPQIVKMVSFLCSDEEDYLDHCRV